MVTMHLASPGPGRHSAATLTGWGPPRPAPAEPLSAAAGPCARTKGPAGGLIRLSGRIPHGGDTQSIILSPGQRPSPADPGKAGCSQTPGPALTGLVTLPDRKAPPEPLTPYCTPPLSLPLAAEHDPLPGGRVKDALRAPATPAGLPPGP